MEDDDQESGSDKSFADLSDTVLLQRIVSGVLTEQALVVARAEVVSRGLSLPDSSGADIDPQDHGAADALVAVVRGVFPLEARIIHGFLEAQGVHAYVADEHLMNALPLWAHAAYGGGARVMVRESDVAMATELLRERKSGECAIGEEDDHESP